MNVGSSSFAADSEILSPSMSEDFPKDVRPKKAHLNISSEEPEKIENLDVMPRQSQGQGESIK